MSLRYEHTWEGSITCFQVIVIPLLIYFLGREHPFIVGC